MSLRDPPTYPKVHLSLLFKLAEMASRATSYSAAAPLAADDADTPMELATSQEQGFISSPKGGLPRCPLCCSVIDPPAVFAGCPLKRTRQDLEASAVLATTGHAEHLLKYVSEGAFPLLTHPVASPIDRWASVSKPRLPPYSNRSTHRGAGGALQAGSSPARPY